MKDKTLKLPSIPEDFIFVFDLDSTLISKEALDELSILVFSGHPKGKETLERIFAITSGGMSGNSFRQSLEKRFDIFSATKINITKSDVERMSDLLAQSLSVSIARNIEWFKENADRIYVISGGFYELIMPAIERLGIDKSHVRANNFIYDRDNIVIGFDHTNVMSTDTGKTDMVRRFAFPGPVIMIGDGMTDRRVYEDRAANLFIPFIENIRRDVVVEGMEAFMAKDLEEAVDRSLTILKELFQGSLTG